MSKNNSFCDQKVGDDELKDYCLTDLKKVDKFHDAYSSNKGADAEVDDDFSSTKAEDGSDIDWGSDTENREDIAEEFSNKLKIVQEEMSELVLNSKKRRRQFSEPQEMDAKASNAKKPVKELDFNRFEQN